MSVASEAEKTRRPTMPGREMLVRIASGIVLAAVTLACAWFGGWAGWLGVSVVVVIVHLEWLGLTGDDWKVGLAFTATMLIAFAAAVAGHTAPGLGLAALAMLAAGATSREPWRPAGILYCATLGFGLLLLRQAPEHGLAAVLFVFAVVWLTDTGAYFAGRAIGGPKLLPAISPKKTWAGAVGGLVAGLVAGFIVAICSGIPLTIQLGIVAVLLSVASQLGDLFESWVKRRFGAKDAGTIVPGHGGLMDRVDGLIFGVGLALLIGWLHGGPDGLANGLLLW
jgi:phosphatidate cytidylyltransferase